MTALPTGWKLSHISALGEVVTGGTPSSKNPELFGDVYPFITPTDMSYTTRYVVTERYLSEEGRQNQKRKLLPIGAVCFVCIGATIGKVCMTYMPSFTNQQINSVVVDDKIGDPRFVYYLLLTLKDKVQGLAAGAATPIVNKSSFSKIEVVVPPLPTQRRIASILSTYDDLIENNTRRIAILEEMAQRLYEEWFVKFRFPGHEEERFKETELGEVPDRWELLPLGDVCDRITDGAHKSPKSVPEGKPMASVKDMHDWGFSLAGCRKISDDDYQELVRNDCKPRKGDVLIAKDGSYLKHTFVVEREVDLAILSSIAILRPNAKVKANWLSLALRHPDVVARMKGIVSGVAIPRIVLKDFRKFLLLIPPIELQERWEMLAVPMMTMCRRLIDKNTNLRSQRDLLLPKLVSGEIDVSEVELPDTEERAA